MSVADLTRAETIAGMAEEVMKEVPEGCFVLVGLSLGGYVAFEIMRQAPERVCGLILLDTWARPETPESSVARRALMDLAEINLDTVIEQLLPKLSHPERVSLPAVRGIIQSMAAGLGKEVFIRHDPARQSANAGQNKLPDTGYLRSRRPDHAPRNGRRNVADAPCRANHGMN